jgi:hypothetical protein
VGFTSQLLANLQGKTMARSENLTGALSSTEDLVAIADLMSKIADTLHHTLREISDLQSVPSEKLYALITEEYGLRTRLGILRGDRSNRVVEGVEITQNELESLLLRVIESIKNAFPRSSSEILKSLRWSTDHWSFIIHGMYVGVELDGHIHS